MTFNEAVALQPAWVQIWLNILLFGVFLLPLSFLFWRQSRLAGIVTLAAAALGAGGVFWLYAQLGYVRLLGLPHILLWTPAAIYLWSQIRRADMPAWPRRLISISLVVIVISLAFDVADVGRWLLGEREALPGTGAGAGAGAGPGSAVTE